MPAPRASWIPVSSRTVPSTSATRRSPRRSLAPGSSRRPTDCSSSRLSTWRARITDRPCATGAPQLRPSRSTSTSTMPSSPVASFRSAETPTGWWPRPGSPRSSTCSGISPGTSAFSPAAVPSYPSAGTHPGRRRRHAADGSLARLGHRRRRPPRAELCGVLAERGHGVVGLVHRNGGFVRTDGSMSEPAGRSADRRPPERSHGSAATCAFRAWASTTRNLPLGSTSSSTAPR